MILAATIFDTHQQHNNKNTHFSFIYTIIILIRNFYNIQ